jgi:hypothetical protein
MYPLQTCKPIVDEFIGCRTRGWERFRQLFYIRREIVYLIFQKDQKLWNLFKHLCKKLDFYPVYENRIPSKNALSYLLKAGPAVYRQFFIKMCAFQETYTDELDYYTYVKYTDV